MLVVITILTTLTLTTTIGVYAGGDDDDDDRDGNKQKAEDDSAAAIADCDDNEVEEARFLCNALATNDVEIETPGEEPPGEEPPAATPAFTIVGTVSGPLVCGIGIQVSADIDAQGEEDGTVTGSVNLNN